VQRHHLGQDTIKGNKYRVIVVAKFTFHYVYIRFIGTHAEYDKVVPST
jgi:mRNA interferase HigB